MVPRNFSLKRFGESTFVMFIHFCCYMSSVYVKPVPQELNRDPDWLNCGVYKRRATDAAS